MAAAWREVVALARDALALLHPGEWEAHADANALYGTARLSHRDFVVLAVLDLEPSGLPRGRATVFVRGPAGAPRQEETAAGVGPAAWLALMMASVIPSH